MRTLLTFLLFLATTALAQPNPPHPQPQRFGPWDSDVVLATSADGFVFDKPTVFVERAGVPHICRDAKDRLIAVFQWFPLDKPDAFDKVAARVSADNGKTWTDPAPLTFKDLPQGQQRPFDPTLLLLEDGRLRLYFTGTNPDNRTPAIYSAISTDGLTYTFEPGVRLAVEGQPVIDCAAARLGKVTHLFSPVQRTSRAYHAVSDDGLTFKRLDDVSIENDTARQRNWLGCALATPDNRIRFYGTGQGVWSATSDDGLIWTLDDTTRAQGADPGVAPTADRRFLLIATGRLRPDAGQFKPPPRRPQEK
jgi:hypothetical protein